MVRRLSLRHYRRYNESHLYVIKFHKYKVKAYINKTMIDIIKLHGYKICFNLILLILILNK